MIQEDTFWAVLMHGIDPSLFVPLTNGLQLVSHLLEDKVKSTLIIHVVFVLAKVLFCELFVYVMESGNVLNGISIVSIIDTPFDNILDVIIASLPANAS